MGHCFIFFPAFFRSSANTISLVRSKNPISFFQLTPHLQCCKPINCCFIFLPQFGQILLAIFTPISKDIYCIIPHTSFHPQTSHHPITMPGITLLLHTLILPYQALFPKDPPTPYSPMHPLF